MSLAPSFSMHDCFACLFKSQGLTQIHESHQFVDVPQRVVDGVLTACLQLFINVEYVHCFLEHELVCFRWFTV